MTLTFKKTSFQVRWLAFKMSHNFRVFFARPLVVQFPAKCDSEIRAIIAELVGPSSSILGDDLLQKP